MIRLLVLAALLAAVSILAVCAALVVLTLAWGPQVLDKWGYPTLPAVS